MKELEYPFAGKFIIGKKLKLRKQLLNADTQSQRLQKKIAVLGGSTTNDIKLCLELFLLNYGIRSDFYESEYNQYYQDAMFPPESLISFAPNIIYICTSIGMFLTMKVSQSSIRQQRQTSRSGTASCTSL